MNFKIDYSAEKRDVKRYLENNLNSYGIGLYGMNVYNHAISS
jgi:hypothetical protein